MNNVLKQRLVGALILVALGVVFWPIIFVEPGAPSGAGQVSIPPAPRVDNTPVAPPDQAGLRNAAPVDYEDQIVSGEDEDTAGDSNSPAPATGPQPQAASEQPRQEAPKPQPAAAKPAATVPAPGQTRAQPPETPALDQQGIPVAWVLQVASVSEAARADELRAKLVAQGHKAYVKKVVSGGKTLYRVRIGPKAEKARLEAIRGDIDAQFGVHSLVVRYYP